MRASAETGFLLLCVLACQSQAQSLLPSKAFGRYQQYVWNDQHGLPQNSVNAITRTRDGYLWVGTFEGAARFDGVRFTSFDHTNTPQFRSNQVLALLEDHGGNLWLATNGGGLIRRRGDTFTLYTTADGLSNDFVRSLVEDCNGVLWIGTEGGGVNRLRNGRFEAFTTRNGLPGDYVEALAVDHENNLWVGTDKGLARFAHGEFTTYTTKNGLAADFVDALCIDHTGTLWVGTRGGGLSRLENSRFVSGGLRPGIQKISAIVEDRSFQLWIGGNGGGLALREHNRYHYFSKAEGFVSDKVISVYQDPEGNMWIGTADQGLCRLRAGRFAVYTMQDGLPADFATAVFQDTHGRLWIGTSNGLASMSKNRITSYSTKDGLEEKDITSIAEDNARDLWFAAGGRLYRFHEGRFAVQEIKSGNASGTAIRLVLGDGAGNLWIGTRGAGLGRLKNGRVTMYTKRDGLADDNIYALYEGRDGALWIGTLTGGVSRMKDGRIATWTTKDGLASNHVLSFYEDRRGTLWIGTGEGGLCRFRDGKFTTIAVKNGLYDNLAFQILPDADDDSGSLWMSCNKGIYRVSLRELEDFANGRRPSVSSYAYGVSDGMLSRECNGGAPAGWKTPDGRLWFPTVKGVVATNPRTRDTREPAVVLEQVTLDHVPLPLEQPLRIKPGQGMLEIQYTGFNWNRPREVRFHYRLEGLDSDWVDAGARRSAYYSHLPPGDYRFHVVASNGEGVWNMQGKTLAITVLPPFYRAWWFVTMLILTAGAAAVLAYARRMRTFARAQAAQQAFSRQLIASQESERKRIAAELHDSLGQRLLIMKNLALLQTQPAARNGANAEAFGEISEEASRALSEVREISYGLRPYQLDRLGLTKAIEGVVRSAGGASKTAFSSDLDNIDDFFPEESRIIVYRIVQECINNIIKHAEAAHAAVTIRREEHSVLLKISDDGRGFTPALTQSDSQRGGFGLIGISERTQLLGGRVTTQSAPGRGTSILVEFHLRGVADGR